MHVQNTELPDVKLIEPPTKFEDFRGRYVELYNNVMYTKNGITLDFIQDDISVSNKHVLRGIHGDRKTWKLVTCLSGAFYLVIVDNRSESPTYRHWISFTLSEHNTRQVLIPPGCGNGHLVMTESAIFHYKQTTEYERDSQFTIVWNDPEYGIWWPVSSPILSVRDSS